MKGISEGISLTVAACLALAFGAGSLAQADEHYTHPYILAHRAAAKSYERFGDLPLGAVIRTDERYGPTDLFQPRGWDYWNRLENPRPIQDPNLWPDKRPTYMNAVLSMPAGSTFTLHGQFPHARYCKMAFYTLVHGTFTALPGASLACWDIEPDPGSTNPFVVGADRHAPHRSFTLHILADDPPKDPAMRAKNTAYVGRDVEELQAIFRIYVSDQSYDGPGVAPGGAPSVERIFTYEGRLADGTELTGEEVAKQFNRPVGFAPPPISVDKWYALVDAKDNDPSLTPSAAPARKDPVFEKFWTVPYTLVGAFKAPEERAKLPWKGLGAQAGADPGTVYLVAYLSRVYGPVFVVRGKMPSFPNTFAGSDGKGIAVTPAANLQYWSMVTLASAPSGELWDGVFDMQVPLDKEGNYTIVVSRPEDRPKNATAEHGVAWIDWGPGEGLDDPRNRKDWGMLLVRMMSADPNWSNSPDKIEKPGEEAAVLGPYYPRGEYTTKEAFETKGPQ
ncbi:MAG TPA: hypothetical protein VMI72_13180 [Roseiarcus sp.]|nr:hypothetical protein [Roseiarcus sp.]